MSSHREAPEISQDPVADSADLYAFVSPDSPGTVTIIANYVPLQGPDGGPNFYSFGDDVLYEINIDNDGDGDADITYQFRFTTTLNDPNSFLYNRGPIAVADRPELEPPADLLGHEGRRGRQGVARELVRLGPELLAEGLACPPCNIGPLSTPDYPSLAQAAVNDLGQGFRVFAGQRADGFYVDLGSIFDLGILRPFEADHNLFGIVGSGVGGSPAGVNATKALNVHSIAIQVPIFHLTSNGKTPSDATSSASVLGIWTSASRQKVHVHDRGGVDAGPWVQVSRLGNPLVNEVVIPLGQKDYWNSVAPGNDKQFSTYFANPGSHSSCPSCTRGCSRTWRPTTPGTPESRGSRGDPAHGDPERGGPRLPELHRPDAGGHAPAQRRHPTLVEPEEHRIAGRRRRRLPQRAARLRRRGHHRGPSHRRRDPAARRPVVHGGRRGGGRQPGADLDDSDLSAKGTESYLSSFPYLGVPYSGFSTPAS